MGSTPLCLLCCPPLAVLRHQPLIQGKSGGPDGAVASRSEDGAIGFVQMQAVAESTLAQMGTEFGQGVREFLVVQME